jgi:hypothetical protein
MRNHVPPDHPLLNLLPLVDAVLQQLSARLDATYSNHHSLIPPEKLLRAVVLRLLYSLGRQRILLEQLRYNCHPGKPLVRVRSEKALVRSGCKSRPVATEAAVEVMKLPKPSVEKGRIATQRVRSHRSKWFCSIPV